jgi:hypothetical protein
MRTGLSPHLGQEVLCKGWIAFWEDLVGLSTRRVVVSNPVIRKADCNLLFEDQVLLTKEHHLNLFIKHQDLPNYDTTFQLHQPIQFSGQVHQYWRADGSSDFGVYAERQSTLHFEIEKVLLAVYKSAASAESTHQLIRDYALPKARQLLNDLDRAGDMLPTFRGTYSTYKQLLEDLLRDSQCVLVHVKSRTFRRRDRHRPSSMDRIRELGS